MHCIGKKEKTANPRAMTSDNLSDVYTIEPKRARERMRSGSLEPSSLEPFLGKAFERYKRPVQRSQIGLRNTKTRWERDKNRLLSDRCARSKHLASQLALRERVRMRVMVVKRVLVLFMCSRGLGVCGTPKLDAGHARFRESTSPRRQKSFGPR
ncbi:hypothetical protein NDU88_006918 [Pleurodeles waltl]|uniref:Uncharacterized protein n=1 Tax=Pleurodeles waltl TaxID=8319 RepID=A0AAV7LTW9_PLEWA|nr:hypothetical protein NDU88_006918 [Pleurodeles waltl]